MKWYYSANREKLGPIDETSFEHLVAAGAITEQTLVWRKGMPEWLPYGEVKTAAVAPPEPAPAPPPTPDAASGSEPTGVTCVSCGAFLLMDGAVRFRDDYVCLGCREEYVRQQDEARQAEECESSDEEIRQEGLKHERRLRTAASVYYFVGGVLALLALGSIVNGNIPQFFIFTIFSALILLGARELFGLRRRAKVAAGCVSGFGLIVFPLGTLIHLYILYLAFCPEGRRLLGERYREVVQRTPHIKCGISWIGAVLLSITHFIAFTINN